MSSKYSKKALRDKLVTRLAGGVKGTPHASKEGIEAAAGRKFSRLVNPKSGQKTAPPPKKK